MQATYLLLSAFLLTGILYNNYTLNTSFFIPFSVLSVLSGALLLLHSRSKSKRVKKWNLHMIGFILIQSIVCAELIATNMPVGPVGIAIITLISMTGLYVVELPIVWYDVYGRLIYCLFIGYSNAEQKYFLWKASRAYRAGPSRRAEYTEAKGKYFKSVFRKKHYQACNG